MYLDFTGCHCDNGFIADFENTDDIVSLMNIDENENPEWYDDYYEEMLGYASEYRLIKFVFGENIFFSEDDEKVVEYIVNNFYTEDGEGYTAEHVREKLESYEPLPTIKEILEKTKIRIAEFSTMMEIPYRTVQDWASGKRTPPVYTVKMIAKLLRIEHHIKEIKDIKEYYA